MDDLQVNSEFTVQCVSRWRVQGNDRWPSKMEISDRWIIASTQLLSDIESHESHFLPYE